MMYWHIENRDSRVHGSLDFIIYWNKIHKHYFFTIKDIVDK